MLTRPALPLSTALGLSALCTLMFVLFAHVDPRIGLVALAATAIICWSLQRALNLSALPAWAAAVIPPLPALILYVGGFA